MYQVLKILNNNTILAKEDDNEIIVMAKGIGFGKKIDEHFEIPPHAKKYMMKRAIKLKINKRKSLTISILFILKLQLKSLKKQQINLNKSIMIFLFHLLIIFILRSNVWMKISCLVIHLPMIYDFFSLMNMKLL